MGYSPDTRKHFRIWVPQKKQIVIANELYIDESERGAKLLAKWPLDVTQTKRKTSAKEPKFRNRLQKNPIEAHIETLMEPNIIGKQEVVMSITKTTCKIYQPGSYDEVVNEPVHGRRQREIIKEELQNLKSYQTWKYKEIPLG